MYEIMDIAQIMEDKGLGTIGVDIFALSADPDSQNYVMLYPSADPPVIDPELPFYFVGKFQAIVRNFDHQTGLNLCKTISNAMTFTNLETPTLMIKRCRPLAQPRIFRRSESGSLEFSVTYEIVFVTK